MLTPVFFFTDAVLALMIFAKPDVIFIFLLHEIKRGKSVAPYELLYSYLFCIFKRATRSDADTGAELAAGAGVTTVSTGAGAAS